MANLQEPLCSWDSTIDERYNDYTTGNTDEVLPGITRPLPADLIREWNYQWLVVGTRELQIEDLVPIPDKPGTTMLPVVGGRFCVNISVVNALTSSFETGGSADYLKQFFEGEEEITAEVAQDTSRAEAVQERLMANFVRARELVNADADRAKAHYAATLARDWTAVDDAGLLAAIDETTDHIGDIFYTHYWCSSGGGLQTTLLDGLLAEHVPDHPAGWMTGLTSGLTDVESARPSKAIWDLSRFVLERPALAEEMVGISVDDFQARLDSPPNDDWTAFAGQYAPFIADLGFRGQRETDPSCLTWNESPQFVLSSLQADLALDEEHSPYVREARSAAERVALEAEVEAALPEDQRAEFRRLLDLVQVMNGKRETTKASWTRLCRTYRQPVLEMGRRLAERGELDDAGDVWFLRLAELPEALDGGLSAAEIQDVVDERRTRYEMLHDYELPIIFQRPVEATPRQTADAGGETSFQGIGVSPGQTRGRARVVLSADGASEATILPGEILVAPVTDAPWTPLFLPAAGVVVETGGLLSHAATVAREYGIPAVTGIRGATDFIATGTMLSIDGSTGTVTIEEG
ncbi:MAG: hypothetical protein F4X03_08560 [Dehalococcoidia bacterium]|nr:hypothetical protein [Dehalococcoidia bacterium]MYD28946.1 hypothetical protein [Dehalococcoidia bacterium]